MPDRRARPPPLHPTNNDPNGIHQSTVGDFDEIDRKFKTSYFRIYSSQNNESGVEKYLKRWKMLLWPF